MRVGANVFGFQGDGGRRERGEDMKEDSCRSLSCRFDRVVLQA